VSNHAEIVSLFRYGRCCPTNLEVSPAGGQDRNPRSFVSTMGLLLCTAAAEVTQLLWAPKAAAVTDGQGEVRV